jgi:hypothetical protein
MAYRCCDKDFQDKKSLFKHIRSNNWHFLTFSDNAVFDLNYNDTINIIKNQNLIFNSLGILKIRENVGFLALPLHKDTYGNILKTGILGKIEGPTYNLGLINYSFKSNKLIYEISFRPRKVLEKTEISSIVTMRVNIGLLGRIFPSSVLKALPNIIPQKVLSNMASQTHLSTQSLKS